jgi:uncharacterized protein YceK
MTAICLTIGVACLTLLGGCASMNDKHPGQPSVAGSQPSATASNGHRQYFDQRRGRYYYFDTASHRYLWEDGTPRD